MVKVVTKAMAWEKSGRTAEIIGMETGIRVAFSILLVVTNLRFIKGIKSEKEGECGSVV
jgi:hypothetical protein